MPSPSPSPSPSFWMTSPLPHPLDNNYNDMPSPLPQRQCEINNTTTRVTTTMIMMCHRPHPHPHPHSLDDDLALTLSLMTRATSPDSLAHARKCMYTQNHCLRVYARLLASAPHLLIPAGKPMQVRVQVSSGVPIGKPVPARRVWVFWRVGYGYGSRYPRVTCALA